MVCILSLFFNDRTIEKSISGVLQLMCIISFESSV